MSDNPYARLYHKFAREYPAVYADDRAFAAWVRLLMVADASWPTRPPVPRSVSSRALRCLQDAGLVLVDGDTYTLRGLEAERTRRSNAARKGAAVRWDSERNAAASADAMPRRDETSRDETREIPPPPAERGRRSDGTNPRATGTAPRQTGASPRANGTNTRQVRIAQKRGPSALSEVLRKAAAAGRDS